LHPKKGVHPQVDVVVAGQQTFGHFPYFRPYLQHFAVPRWVRLTDRRPHDLAIVLTVIVCIDPVQFKLLDDFRITAHGPFVMAEVGQVVLHLSDYQIAEASPFVVERVLVDWRIRSPPRAGVRPGAGIEDERKAGVLNIDPVIQVF